MAKRIIKIIKGGASAADNTASDPVIKGPMRPLRLGEEPASYEEIKRTQPMQRMIVASSSPKRLQSAAGRTSTSRGVKPTPQRKKQKSGPPLWLIPVVIVGLIVLVMIIAAVSSNSKQAAYYQNHTDQYGARQIYRAQTGPQPMKE